MLFFKEMLHHKSFHYSIGDSGSVFQNLCFDWSHWHCNILKLHGQITKYTTHFVLQFENCCILILVPSLGLTNSFVSIATGHGGPFAFEVTHYLQSFISTIQCNIYDFIKVFLMLLDLRKPIIGMSLQMMWAMAIHCVLFAFRCGRQINGLHVRYAEHNGYRFCYLSRGKPGLQPSILMLHGFTVQKDMWLLTLCVGFHFWER